MEASSSRKRKHDADEQEGSYSGYIHKTSPLKLSKNNIKYFNAVVQTDKDYREVVVFNERIHSAFALAEKKRSPVKLANCQVLPNRTNVSKMDLRFGSNARFQYIDKLPFRYEKEDVADTQQNAKAKDIQSMEINSKVSITAKVGSTLVNKEVFMYGKLKPMKKVIICDETGSVPLVLWEGHMSQIAEEDSFLFTNVSIKYYSGEKYLTTTPATTITKVDSIDCTTHQQIPSMTGSIESIQVSNTLICNNCHTIIEGKPMTITYKCTNCHMRQRSNSIVSQMKSKFVVKCATSGKSLSLSADGTCLKTFLDAINCSELDTDSIEEAILSCDKITVSYQNQDTLKIERC